MEKISEAELKRIIVEIKRKNDLIDYFEKKGVEFTYKSGDYFALCPFHGEKTPSFSVVEKKGDQFFYCFGCHASGDFLEAYTRLEGVGLFEAIGRLHGDVDFSINMNDYKDVIEGRTIVFDLEEEVLKISKDINRQLFAYYNGLKDIPEDAFEKEFNIIEDAVAPIDRMIDNLEYDRLLSGKRKFLRLLDTRSKEMRKIYEGHVQEDST